MSLHLLLPADAGAPMSKTPVATARVQRHPFPSATRQVSIRNTGTNTLWFSLDQENWIDIACGTSWDDRVNVTELWYCTQVGKTRFVVVGLALMSQSSSDGDDDER